MAPNEYLGVFSEPASLGIGDPFYKKRSEHSRFGGKQIGNQGPKVGRLPEVYIDKELKTYSTGEPYIDPFMVDRIARKRAGEHPPTGKPFKPTSSIRSHPTVGHPEVALGQVYLDSVSLLHSGVRPKTVPEKKNLYTRPSPAGNSGYPLQIRNIGGQTYPYVSDAYEAGRQLERELRKKDKIEKPFGAPGISHPRHVLFNAMSTMTDESTLAFKAPGSRPSTTPAEGRPTFKFPNPSKKGRNDDGLISRFGRNYVEDPARGGAPFRPKEAGAGAGPVFRPLSSPKRRGSMWTVNPYARDVRPAPNVDFTTV